MESEQTQIFENGAQSESLAMAIAEFQLCREKLGELAAVEARLSHLRAVIEKELGIAAPRGVSGAIVSVKCRRHMHKRCSGGALGPRGISGREHVRCGCTCHHASRSPLIDPAGRGKPLR